jgi:hypothetical protein
MPSQALAELSAQIERQKTDSFGKFYLYATLLHKITIRDRTKTFAQTMPFYTDKRTGGLTTTPVKAGTLDSSFNAQVTNYQAQFDVKVPDFVLSIQRIALSFIRKGQLSDLAFIIDKMNEHLGAEPMAEELYNASIYSNASFDSRKGGLYNLLQSAQQVSRLTQDIVDNAGYAFITIIATLLSLKLTMLLGGLLLTMGMLAAGGYATYYFLATAIACVNRIEAAMNACNEVGQKLYMEQAGNVGTPNNLNFIINGVLAPIAFANVTVQEQTATDLHDYQMSQQNREAVTEHFAKLNRW